MQTSFTWLYCEAGYEWQDHSGSGRSLVRKGNTHRHYQVPATLAPIAADLAPDENGIREFANHYGDLFSSAGGRSLTDWQGELLSLSQAVWLWENRNNQKELTKIVEWHGRHAVVRNLWYRGKKRDVVVNKPVNSDSLLSIKLLYPKGKVSFEGNLKALGRELLSFLINDRLKEYGRVVFDHRQVPPLKITSDYLLGYLWLQVSEIVAGDIEYIRCKICGTPVQLQGKMLKKGKMYCSNKCKQTAKRQRKTKSKRKEVKQ